MFFQYQHAFFQYQQVGFIGDELLCISDSFLSLMTVADAFAILHIYSYDSFQSQAYKNLVFTLILLNLSSVRTILFFQPLNFLNDEIYKACGCDLKCFHHRKISSSLTIKK